MAVVCVRVGIRVAGRVFDGLARAGGSGVSAAGISARGTSLLGDRAQTSSEQFAVGGDGVRGSTWNNIFGDGEGFGTKSPQSTVLRPQSNSPPRRRRSQANIGLKLCQVPSIAVKFWRRGFTPFSFSR